MREIVKEYSIDLSKGKIYTDNEEVFKYNGQSYIDNLSIFIDENIDDKLVYRFLNVYSFIFNYPKNIFVLKDNKSIQKWTSKNNISLNIESDINQNISKSNATLIIWNNKPDDLNAFEKFYKEYFLIDVKASELVLIHKYFINEKNKINISNRWLPKQGIIKV